MRFFRLAGLLISEIIASIKYKYSAKTRKNLHIEIDFSQDGAYI